MRERPAKDAETTLPSASWARSPERDVDTNKGESRSDGPI